MLDALTKQNNAMIYMAVEGEDIEKHRESCEQSIKKLSETTLKAREIVSKTETPEAAEQLIYHANRINALATELLNGKVENELAPEDEEQEVTDGSNNLYDDIFSEDGHSRIYAVPQQTTPERFSAHKWYIETYQAEYLEMSHQITAYMTGSHNTLGPDVNNLSHTARRAVTPVSITLIVMIAIVLMFYYFFMVYIVKPIQRIDRSLGTYLTYKMPFDDSIRSRDEIRGVRDKIAALISKIR